MNRFNVIPGIPGIRRLENIDRTKTCPFLLRVYYNINGHSEPSAYINANKDIFPPNEILVYSWLDATLSELTSLITMQIDVENLTKTQANNINLSFSSVFLKTNGQVVLKKLGSFPVLNLGRNDSDTKERSLFSLGFSIGDCLDVAILTDYNRR